MEGKEFGGPVPQEITGESPIIEQQQETPPVPVEQKVADEEQPRPHRSKAMRKFEGIVREDEERKRSPVGEGAPKFEFEESLVGALKDPEMAHEIALTVKPLEDLIVEKKVEIRGLFSEIEEMRGQFDGLTKLPDETESDFEKRRNKSYETSRNRVVELEEKLGLMKDFLFDARRNQRSIIDAFERIRLAKLAGGGEPLKAAENLLSEYIGVVLSTKRQEERSDEVDRRVRYRDVMREGTFLEKMLLRLREKEYEIREEFYYEEMSLPEFLYNRIKDKIERGRIISGAEEEVKKILGSLGIEGVASISFDKVVKNWSL